MILKCYNGIAKTGKCQKIAEEHMISRNYYLKQLIEKKHSSKIKIVTGLRRSGKSYLLGVIFRQHLTEKARHTLFLMVGKTYHLLFPRVKGYTLIKK